MHEVRTVQFLVEQISHGDILLPEFQRGYVWSRSQVRELVQSLYQKHPTGHLLIWRTHKPSPTRGSQKQHDGFSLLLLDGQQRLTSLYALFTGKAPSFYEGENLFFDLFFNLQTEEFQYWQKLRMQNNPAWISVPDVLKNGLRDFFQNIDKLSSEKRNLIQAHLDPLTRLNDIRNYTYTVDQISGDEFGLGEVVEIFNRVNSEGTRLSKADLALAHLSSVWPEARAELRSFQDTMSSVGYDIDYAILLRCLVGVATGSVVLDRKFARIGPSELARAWKSVRPAAEYLVAILRHEAYAGAIKDLPTTSVLVPITIYLAKRGSRFPTEVTKRRFIRWLYLACLWGRYSGASETKLQQDVSLVLVSRNDPTKQLEEAIVQERGRIVLEASDLKDKRVDSAVGKMSQIVARATNACDLFNTNPLYSRELGKSYGAECGYVFSKSVLQKHSFAGRVDPKTVNQVANRVFLTEKAPSRIRKSSPSEYLLEIAKNRPDDLRAQCIPLAKDTWKVKHFREFLIMRQRMLCKAINEYIRSWSPPRSGVDETLSCDVRNLLVRGESANLEFKESLRWDRKRLKVNKDLEKAVLKTIAGFMNARGGTLLIGVDDGGQVLGIDEDYGTLSKKDRDGFELKLGELLAVHVGESCSMYLTVNFHDLSGKDVCSVSAAKSESPIYVSYGGRHYFFLRVGNQTRELDPKESNKYVEKRWATSGSAR